MQRLVLLFLICFALGQIPDASATECARCRIVKGWGCASEPTTAFDDKTMVTLEGKVVSVQQVEPDVGLTPGVYILLESKEGNFACRLGSESNMSSLNIQPNDNVSLHGSKIHKESGIPAIIATDITKDGQTVTIR